jgi:TRAP-type C4-dicarboxylate transport system substrate-binding protein
MGWPKAFMQCSIAALLTVLLFQTSMAAEPAVIKIATLAPDGTAWAELASKIKRDIESATSGRVRVILYLGGVMGNDKDTVRKLRLGQLQGGGFSAEGTFLACPETGVMQLPYLVDSYEKADRARELIRPDLDAAAQKNGFKLLCFIEQGYDALYSKDFPIRKLEDMKKVRTYAWSGPIEEEMLKALGTSPFAIGAAESVAALRSGIVNTAPAPAQWVLGTQEYTFLKYINLHNWHYMPAAIVLTQKAFASVSSEDQRAILEIGKRYEPLFVKEARESERKCYEAFQEYGMQMVTLNPQEEALFRKRTRPVWDKLAGRYYSKEMLKKIEALGAR